MPNTSTIRGNAGDTLETFPTAIIVTAKSSHRLASERRGPGSDSGAGVLETSVSACLSMPDLLVRFHSEHLSLRFPGALTALGLRYSTRKT